MDIIKIEQEFLIEYVTDMLSTYQISDIGIDNAKYHHTTKYKDAPSVCEHGILTLVDQNKQGIRNDSEDFIKKMNDTDSHINGANGVSLAVVGLKDLTRDEFEYNPFEPTKVDFLVSSDIKVRRDAKHYGNEFICSQSIGLDKIRSVDVRIFDLINKASQTGIKIPNDLLIEIYNYLIEISKALVSNGHDIPLREMSEYGSMNIDVEKVSKALKIYQK